MSLPEPVTAPVLRRHNSHIPRSRKAAFRSFQNLVSLANDQERWKLTDVPKMGKQLVWRDVGEPPVLLEGLRECAEHAGIGGIRAGALGFAARSGVNIFILLFTLARTPRRIRSNVVLRAIFNSDSVHFGAMLGTFVAVYKFIVNALPILALRLRQRREHAAGQGPDGSLHADIPLEDGQQHEPESLSSYPSSDAEHGLSMSSLARQKSALKNINFTPLEHSTPASYESSRAPSPVQSSEPPKLRHARFAEGPELIQPPTTRSSSGRNPETARHALRHPGHLSTTTQAAVSLMREKGYVYKRWHATVAGAIAGALAIVMEKKGRRLGISQQMFVRGLQGSFNHWSERFGIEVPFGSVLTFAFCCGQIMYGYLLRPDTIPPSYNSWIQKASIVPQEAIKINRQLVYQGTLDIESQQRLADGLGRPWNGSSSIVTEGSRKGLLDHIEMALAGDHGPPMATCAAIHPHHDSCVTTGFSRIYEAGIWMAPMYGALHFIPMLLFKRSAFMKAPLKMTLRALFGTLRSASFLGVFVAIYQSYICFIHFLYLLPIRPDLAVPFRKFIVSKPVWWFGGILSGMSLFVEEKKRREELAMYVLPKGLESGWKLFRGEIFGVPTRRKERGWKSDVALCAAGMGMVMSTYQHSPQHLSGLVRRLLYQFVGPN